MRRVADLLRTTPAEVPERVEKLLGQIKELTEELDNARSRQAAEEARMLAGDARDGVLVARRDGNTPDDLRRLAAAARDAMGTGVAAMIGLSPDGTKAGLAVAVTPDLVDKGWPPPRWPPKPPRPWAEAPPRTPTWWPAEAPRWTPSRRPPGASKPWRRAAGADRGRAKP